MSSYLWFGQLKLLFNQYEFLLPSLILFFNIFVLIIFSVNDSGARSLSFSLRMKSYSKENVTTQGPQLLEYSPP